MDVVTYALLLGKIKEMQQGGVPTEVIKEIINKEIGMHNIDVTSHQDIRDDIQKCLETVEVDTTLTQSGKAADAKVVGDKLKKKQPVGNYLTEIPSEYVTETELNGKKLPNPHKLTFEGSVTAEYDGSGAVSVVIPETGNVERVEKLASDTTVDILPNKLYVFPEMANLTVTLGAVSDEKIVNEYHFVFKSGATPTVLSIPQTVHTPSSFSVLANTVYEVSIMENCMTYQSWEVSA